MPWIELERPTSPGRGPSVPKEPRLTLYKDGLAKLNRPAWTFLGMPERVHVLHHSDNMLNILVTTGGKYPHKVGKGMTFSAKQLWRMAGGPAEPFHIALAADPEGVGLTGHITPVRAVTEALGRATVNGSEGALATAAAAVDGGVDPETQGSLSGPPESSPSDTPLFDPYASDDEPEDYETEEPSSLEESVGHATR